MSEEWTEIMNGRRTRTIWKADVPPPVPGTGIHFRVLKEDVKEEPDGSMTRVILKAELLSVSM